MWQYAQYSGIIVSWSSKDEELEYSFIYFLSINLKKLTNMRSQTGIPGKCLHWLICCSPRMWGKFILFKKFSIICVSSFYCLPLINSYFQATSLSLNCFLSLVSLSNRRLNIWGQGQMLLLTQLIQQTSEWLLMFHKKWLLI